MQRHGIDLMHLVEVNTTLTLPPSLLQTQLAHLTYHNVNVALSNTVNSYNKIETNDHLYHEFNNKFYLPKVGLH